MKIMLSTQIVFKRKLYVCNRRFNSKRIIKQLCYVEQFDGTPERMFARVRFVDGSEGKIFMGFVDGELAFVDGGGKPTLFEATSKFKLAELAKRNQALVAAQAEYDEMYNALAEDN